MLEFIFDTTRAVSDLVFTGTLVRYPDIEWVFTHGGGALPLAGRRPMEWTRSWHRSSKPISLPTTAGGR